MADAGWVTLGELDLGVPFETRDETPYGRRGVTTADGDGTESGVLWMEGHRRGAVRWLPDATLVRPLTVSGGVRTGSGARAAFVRAARMVNERAARLRGEANDALREVARLLGRMAEEEA